MIHHAVDAGNIEAVKWAVGKGVSVNVVDVYKNTPMHVAVISKNLEMVKYLFKVGGDPLLTNKDKTSSLDLCIDSGGEMREFFEVKKEYAGYFDDRSIPI